MATAPWSRLTHRNLPGTAFATHQAGWDHYLDRLVVRAAGGDPAPTPGGSAEDGHPGA
jgi:hypothetical protein